MRLLNKSGKLLVTHSSGGDSIQKILKLAFKDKEAFPNTAKDIIDYFNISEKKIVVVYQGCNTIFQKQLPLESKNYVIKKYFLLDWKKKRIYCKSISL